ncbi:hypothetical protein RB595_003574 [Gaeumannomyces hyphopodioides]
MASTRMMISAVALSSLAGVYAAPQMGPRGMRPNEPAVFGVQPTYTYDPVTNTSTEITDPSLLGPHVTSPRFRLFLMKDGTGETAEQARAGLEPLEAAYDCFVGDLGWNSTGLRILNNEGKEPYLKTDITMVKDHGGSTAAGTAHYGPRVYIHIDAGQLYPRLSVHEWGHALQWHQGNAWPNLDTYRIWSETFAQWVTETYLTSDLCAAARARHNQSVGDSLFQPFNTIARSYLAIVDGTPNSPLIQGNNYDAWPFFHYLMTNLDGWKGMGRDGIMTLTKETPLGGNRETPLHVLQRVLGDSATVQQVVSKYWARMAYADIGHAMAVQRLDENKGFMNKDTWVRVSNGEFKSKPGKSPRYMGAVLARLLANGDGSYLEGKTNTTSRVKIAIKDATGPYTATLAVRNKASKEVRYIAMPGGNVEVDISYKEEATLAVVNTPEKLISYVGVNMYGAPRNDSTIAPESEWDPANREITFSFSISGADVATF